MKIKDLDSKDFKKDELVMILLRFLYKKGLRIIDFKNDT